MAQPPLVIVAAAAREVAAVRRALRVQRRGRWIAYEYAPSDAEGIYRWWEGEAGGCPLVLIRSGIGPRRAGRAAEEACVEFRPRGLLALGLAGALRADLRPGALIVAERTRPDGMAGPDPVAVTADAGMLRAAIAAGRAAAIATACGTLVTLPGLVATPEAKAALAASTGAVAVDMESGAVAAVAARAGLPFLAAKIVFDAADEPLHPALMEVVRADGSPRFLRAAGLAARDPAARAALHWAGRRSRLAASILTRFCRVFLPMVAAGGHLDGGGPFP